MTNKPTLKDWIQEKFKHFGAMNALHINTLSNAGLLEIISDYLEAHKEPEAKQEQKVNKK